MRILIMFIVLLLSGCAAIPEKTNMSTRVLEIPPVPTLSPEAKKDAKQAYVELVQSYKELRIIAKDLRQELDAKPTPPVCSVKFGDFTLPIVGLGDIHFVIFSYCKSKF